MRNIISTQLVVRISHVVVDVRVNVAETLRGVLHTCTQMWEGPGYPGSHVPEPLFAVPHAKAAKAASFAASKPWRVLCAADQTCHRSMR